jgi:predicted TIM-barrel fold metal-dependent hydrolase
VGDPYQDYSAPKRLGKVLDMMPHLKVIAAHLGGYRAWEEGKRHLVGRKGVWLDSSSTIGYLSAEESKKIILAHGCDKVLWGSDYPARRHQGAIEDIRKLGLSQEQQEMIFYRNAEKLFSSIVSNT